MLPQGYYVGKRESKLDWIETVGFVKGPVGGGAETKEYPPPPFQRLDRGPKTKVCSSEQDRVGDFGTS